MSQIGSSLAEARKAHGLELADIERLTSIRMKYLEALEAERFADLPGRAYGRAFLRSYASTLGLDADPLVHEFDERFPRSEEELPPVPVRRRRVFPTRLALIAAAAALVVGFVAWSNMSTSGTPKVSMAPTPAVRESPAPLRPPDAERRSPVPAAHGPLVISAVRGNCWLYVRKGSETGPVLFEATLEEGKVARFAAPRVWARFGAPWNVDVRRGGKPVPGLATNEPVNVVA